MGSIEILGSLYMKPDRTIDLYEIEKSHIAFWSNLSKCLHDIKYRYIGIDFKFNTRYELSSVHVFSTGSMTHFSDFFSYLLTSFCHFVFIEWFFSQLFKQLTLKKQK